MRMFSKILVGVGILAAIAVVGIVIGWLGSRGSTHAVPPPAQTSSDLSPANHSPMVTSNATSSTPMTNDAAVIPVLPAPGTESANTNLADWEDRVEAILSPDTDNTNKVAQLLDLFPHLPEDGQVEVAQHLSNLVADENYAPLGQLLQNAKLPEQVLDILMADALNRPNGVKLPVLLDVAQNPDNAKAGEAKDLLELYLDGDYGTDWNQWRQKLQQWLKENPD